MHFRLRHRLSLTERCTWLLLTLLIGITLHGHAQTGRPVNLSNNPARPTRAFTPEERAEDLPARNHGTGLRLGVLWAAARTAVSGHRLPAVFEVGAFHQRAFGRVGSVQVEALFFRQSGDSATAATTGLRLPVLLVINPFDNVSFHVGPQVSWAKGLGAPVEAGRRTSSALAAGIVAGAEARVERLRVGLRYGTALAALVHLSTAGQAVAAAWKAGQVQVYLGVGLGR